MTLFLREKKSQKQMKSFVLSYPNPFSSLLPQLECYLYNFINVIYTTNCYKTISYGITFAYDIVRLTGDIKSPLP